MGIDDDGKVGKGLYAIGKRHAAFYNKHHDKVIKVQDNKLILGGYKLNERDGSILDSHHPYIHPQNNEQADHRNKLYTGWIDTYATSYIDGNH